MQTQTIDPATNTMFNESQLADRWKISVRTLQDWRFRKIGPRYIKLRGWAVRYSLEAIVEFEEQSMRLAG